MASKQQELRIDKLVTHVVDWHNAHPLVNRISGLRVHTMGFVAVPYLAPPGTPVAQLQDSGDIATGTLRQRAMQRASGEFVTDRTEPVASTPPGPPVKTGDAAFDEAFFAPFSAARLAAWVAQHGSARPRLPRGATVRHIPPRANVDMSRVHWRWVLTAQVDRGNARIRLLVGAGDPPAVLGPRMWSPARIVALLFLVIAIAGVVAGLMGSGDSPAKVIPPPSAAPTAPPPPAAPPEPPASVLAPLRAPASAAAMAPDSAPSAASVQPGAPAPASAPVQPSAAAPAAPAASRPPNVDPQLGKVNLPSLGPIIEERRRASERARAQSASAAGALAVQPAFAVWTRVLRTRAESDQMAEAMRDLLRTPENPKFRVEVLSVGSDWRVVGWPYADRKQAEQARALLATRGMRVDAVEF